VGASLVGDLKDKLVVLPDISLSTVEKQIELNNLRISEIASKIESLKAERGILEKGIAAFEGERDFESRKSGLWESDEIFYLKGYICEKDLKKLQQTVADKGWGLLINDPNDEDDVPTLTENPKWVRIIQPVFDMLGTIPGYNEFDISSLFLIFLTIFFAMIIGDAGYGFIFLGIALFAGSKQKDTASREPLILMFVMSGATILWGAVTGTWFGSETLTNLSFLKLFKIEAISSFNENNSELIKKITFIIGTIHLSIAHIKKFIKEFPALKAFSQIGWLGIVGGLFFLVLNLVLDPQKYPLSPVHLALILGGIVMVVIFEEQDRNFIKGVLKGLMSLPLKFLDCVSAFSDIISYIRLFAVGLATVEIAKSFNLMAEKMADGPTGIIMAVFLLLVGHSLNIAMSALSVVVHGIRLKMLEFSGHLGMEWKGHDYKPFSNSKIIFRKE
jgi:V/A-type H+-transporting ATPase subunit I